MQLIMMEKNKLANFVAKKKILQPQVREPLQNKKVKDRKMDASM